MKTQKSTIIFCLIISFGVFYNCSSISYETIYPTLKDGKYDSEFPYKSTSEELNKISETIQRVSATSFYEIYIFDEKVNFTLSDIQNTPLTKIASKKVLADNSSAGTAVTVYSQDGNIALLTCAHTITFPDTITAYKINQAGEPTSYIESISIKTKQVIYVAGFPDGSAVDILAIDERADLAIIGKKYGAQNGIFCPSLKYPIGKAKDVDWGTFVYVLGYPINYKMITKAIVSSPNRDINGSFLIDAVVNPGFSGGLVLAIRDGVPNFEIIGIVQWVPEEDENIIYPENLVSKISYNPVVPYAGNIYVRKHKAIRYGITKVIPVEMLMEFVEKNKTVLNEKGFYIFQ
jgi:hypothetical protein